MTIAEENSIVEPRVFIDGNKNKTNDADLSCCSCFFWFSPVFGCPRYTGLLTDLLAPGAGK